MRRLVAAGQSLGALEALSELVATADVDPPPGRPWVSTDMVMSIDGAFTRAGTSGGLSSDADHALFIAHRSIADAILVGASTVREERYRRPVVSAEAADIRRRRHQTEVPDLVITSVSLQLGADTPLLEGEPPAPIIAHPACSDTSGAPPGLELIEVGDSEVDMAELLAVLARRGIRRVACEGGPRLLGQLAAADLIDEYLVTISPHLVGGARTGLLGGIEAGAGSFELHRVLRSGDHLMCSYRRNRGADG